jgi:small subunit ribosomal protein S8e
LSVWHGILKKKKPSGGKKRAYRKKRKFEKGSFPIETALGKKKNKIIRKRGGKSKIKMLSNEYVCLTNKKNGKSEKVEILRVISNPANVDYDRRGVITKGAIIETKKGTARITSRPGQNGAINAVLIKK